MRERLACGVVVWRWRLGGAAVLAARTRMHRTHPTPSAGGTVLYSVVRGVDTVYRTMQLFYSVERHTHYTEAPP